MGLKGYAAIAAVLGLVWSHGYLYNKGVTVGKADVAAKVSQALETERKDQAAKFKELREERAAEQTEYEKTVEQLRAASRGSDWDKCVMPDAAYGVLRDAHKRYAAE